MKLSGRTVVRRCGAISLTNVINQLTDGVPYQQVSIAKVTTVEGGWELIANDSTSLGTYDVVCMAAGVGTMDIMGPETFPLRANRGQLTYLSSLEPTQCPLHMADTSRRWYRW